MAMNPYDSLNSGALQPYKQKFNFLDVLDKQGRLNVDPSGRFIPKNFRVKLGKFLENPRNMQPATAFEPILGNLPQTPNFLAAFGGGMDPMQSANPIQDILSGIGKKKAV